MFEFNNFCFQLIPYNLFNAFTVLNDNYHELSQLVNSHLRYFASISTSFLKQNCEFETVILKYLKVKLAICITVYSEDKLMLKRTL